ncbi:hypothetical protein [Streptomyces platensis]|uniref:hypothetical protein n=1 Tax=Streptomyces platensis TaxID=58346 RepID=UPI0038655A00|nr:hypothetical protein OG962_14910 [Streptomyces platensis]
MADDQPKKVDESEFLDIAKDPAAARVMRKGLEQIAKGGAGEILKEMAQEVISGRVGLREAVRIPAYSDQMIEKFEAFKQDWDSLSEMERQQRAAEGGRYLEDQRRELEEAEREGRSNSKHAPRGRHDGSSWSLY